MSVVRLQPIFDAIDQENYALAIKICNKALVKDQYRDAQSIKALKSLALCRSGLYQPAYDLAIEVKLTKPTEPYALQFCFMTLKMLHMHEDIIELYANAFNQQPGNEEWANHWFMGLARKGDWKQLQQAAVKINRQFKQDKYYFWIVVSIYLQSKSNANNNSGMLLTLAERMMQKGAQESKINDLEGIFF